MDLTLKKENSKGGEDENTHFLLQTDPVNLAHLTEELERALVESRSRHSRRIQRAFLND